MNFSSLVASSGHGSLEVLSVDSERVLCRGWRDDGDDDRKAVLAALSASKHPTPEFVNRLAHEYALKDELDGRSAVRPLALVTKVFEAFNRRRFVSTAGVALVAASQSGLGAASAERNKLDVVHVKPRMRKESGAMGFVNVGRENSTPIDLYYEDHGSGLPVVLIHGWPLNGDAWEKQTAALLAAGHRVITYDRRGFGRSSKPGTGYNYDTFAADLDVLLNTLNVTNVSLVGHSMGTGEITRYIGKYGTKRLRKAVLIGTLGPYLVKAPDNPEGIDASVFSGIQAGIKADRPVAMMEFLKNFYSVGGADGKLVSERVIQANWTVAIGASPIATAACVDAWIEDFRKDISRNDLPTLIVHGDDDRILPADVTSRRQAKLMKGVKSIEIKGGSHGIPWTHAEEINNELVKFLS